MEQQYSRRMGKILIGIWLGLVANSVFAYQHHIKPVRIWPGIAKHGCTTCNAKEEKCPPCNTTYHPRPPRAPVKVVKDTTKRMPGYNPAYITRVGNFNRIEADGNVIVRINNAKLQQVQVYNNGQPGHQMVNAYTHHGTLYLRDITRDSKGKIHHPPVLVKIDTPPLDNIILHDQVTFVANKVNSKEINIATDTSGTIRLRGQIHVHYIKQYGCGTIDLEWVDTDHLHVYTSGKGKIRLAGKVGVLEATAIDDSHLDARFLRADNALVRTAGTAEADVTVIDALSGFASGFSNVYYFKTPIQLTRHTYQSGVVMQLEFWS